MRVEREPAARHAFRGKSVTSALVGIAIDRKLITREDQPIAALLPPGLPPESY